MKKSKRLAKKIFWPVKLTHGVKLDTSLIPFKNYAYFSFLLSLATVVFVLVFLAKLPPQVPLFYGLPEGEAQLAPKLGLILPSLVALAILIINIMISMYLEDEFLKKTLILTSIGITFFAAITTFKIVFLVGAL